MDTETTQRMDSPSFPYRVHYFTQDVGFAEVIRIRGCFAAGVPLAYFVLEAFKRSISSPAASGNLSSRASPDSTCLLSISRVFGLL
jgi:hypothetical protein